MASSGVFQCVVASKREKTETAKFVILFANRFSVASSNERHLAHRRLATEPKARGLAVT